MTTEGGTSIRRYDQRWPKIVDALVRRTGASRVTEVRELQRGVFSGRCWRYQRWKPGEHTVKQDLGTFIVTARECGL